MERERTTERLEPDVAGEPTYALRDVRARARTAASGEDGTFSLDGEAAAPRLEPGALVIGRYRLGERLGAGGFGVVWLALDERLDREVALKSVPREGLGAWARTEREARAAARLGHPGIVALYELGSDAERAYLVSEYVPGWTLAELIEGGAISDRDVARVGEAMCDALAHAHGRGVVHRDVKPQNIMVVAEPAAGAGFAKLADFGASRLASEDVLTQTGDVVGTLAYMAPEQAAGLEVSGEADLYALAITLYEALVGWNPVRGQGLADTARRVGTPLPTLGRTRPELPAGLTRAVDRALDPDPAWRGTLDDLREGLARPVNTLSGKGGLEEPATIARFGLARRPRRSWVERLGAAGASHPFRDHRAARRPPLEGRGADDPYAEGFSRSRGLGRLAARLAAGAGAATLAVLALELLLPGRPPVEPVVAGAGVGVAVALLPRIGWLVAAGCIVAWLGLGDLERQGAAVMAAAAASCVPVLLPRAGALWSAPAVAVALGWIALGPASCALAGLARGTLRRAGLAAGAFLWVALAEVASGERLVFGAPEGTGSPARIAASASAAVRDGLVPLLTTPALLPALAWVAFAVVLPLAVRGRSLGQDLLLGAVWAAGLVLAHRAMGEYLAEWGLATDPRGALGGALLGALTAVVAAPVLRRMASE